MLDVLYYWNTLESFEQIVKYSLIISKLVDRFRIDSYNNIIKAKCSENEMTIFRAEYTMQYEPIKEYFTKNICGMCENPEESRWTRFKYHFCEFGNISKAFLIADLVAGVTSLLILLQFKHLLLCITLAIALIIMIICIFNMSKRDMTQEKLIAKSLQNDREIDKLEELLRNMNKFKKNYIQRLIEKCKEEINGWKASIKTAFSAFEQFIKAVGLLLTVLSAVVGAISTSQQEILFQIVLRFALPMFVLLLCIFLVVLIFFKEAVENKINEVMSFQDALEELLERTDAVE